MGPFTPPSDHFNTAMPVKKRATFKDNSVQIAEIKMVN